MSGPRLAHALRASSSWRLEHWGELSSVGTYALSCLAVLAIDGLVAIALGYSLWGIMHGRIEAL